MLNGGVGCSPIDSRVVTLELGNSSLKGFLALEIGSLISLQKLILDHNILMGSIPKGIGKLRNLTVLNLSTNQFVGAIPSEIGDMSKILKLDLQSNQLDGAIPSEIGELTSLTELRLSNNRLTGTIPGSNDSSMVSTNSDGQIGLCRLTQITDMDLSYNFLVGDIPTCFMKIQRSSLVGNCFENNGTMNRPAHQSLGRQGTMPPRPPVSHDYALRSLSHVQLHNAHENLVSETTFLGCSHCPLAMALDDSTTTPPLDQDIMKELLQGMRDLYRDLNALRESTDRQYEEVHRRYDRDLGEVGLSNGKANQVTWRHHTYQLVTPMIYLYVVLDDFTLIFQKPVADTSWVFQNEVSQ
ncbi:hypothetical protein GUJ93_ZPchr0096g33741 [Zizania palustris]|uniref:Disease resistance R13L4/SHOC-2-like LRR domain-containing protein n=1 Tax=Zizania palustris TaxID=103762 RepID=A0A8J5UZA1_ZIZPA|nr:hypothetical protein GUJ93_ZPchr0096g33741 [Zizania palustris]